MNNMEEDPSGNWCFSLAERRIETVAQVFCVCVWGGGELLSVGGKKRDC